MISESLYVRIPESTHLAEAKEQAELGKREELWALVCASCRTERTQENVKVFSETPTGLEWLCLGHYISYLRSDLACESVSTACREGAEIVLHYLLSLHASSSCLHNSNGEEQIVYNSQVRRVLESEEPFKKSLLECLKYLHNNARVAVVAIENKINLQKNVPVIGLHSKLSKSREIRLFLFALRWCQVPALLAPLFEDFVNLLTRIIKVVEVPCKKEKGRKKAEKAVENEKEGVDILSHVCLLVGATFNTLRYSHGGVSINALLGCREELWGPLVPTFLRFHLKNLGDIWRASQHSNESRDSMDTGEDEYSLVSLQDFLAAYEDVFSRNKGMMLECATVSGDSKALLWSTELLQLVNKCLNSKVALTKKICAGRCFLLLLNLLYPDQIETILLGTQRKASNSDKKVFDSLSALFKVDLECYLSVIEAMIDAIFCKSITYTQTLIENRDKFKAVTKPLLRALHPVLTGPSLEGALFEQLVRIGQKMCQATWPHTRNLLDAQVASSTYTLIDCPHFQKETIEAVSGQFGAQDKEPMNFECLLHCLLADGRGEVVCSTRALIAIHWILCMVEGGTCMFADNEVDIRSGLYAQTPRHPTGQECEPLGVDDGTASKPRGFVRSCITLLRHSFESLHKVYWSSQPGSEHLRQQCQFCFKRLTRAWQILLHALVQSVLQSAPGRKAATQSQFTQGSIFHSTGTQNAMVRVLSKEDPIADAVCHDVTSVFWHVWTLVFCNEDATFFIEADKRADFLASRELFIEAYWWLIFKLSAFSLKHESSELFERAPRPAHVAYSLSHPKTNLESMWFAMTTTFAHLQGGGCSGGVIMRVVAASKRGIEDRCLVWGSELHATILDWLSLVSRKECVPILFKTSVADVTVAFAQGAAQRRAIVNEYCGILWQSLFKGLYSGLPFDDVCTTPSNNELMDDFAEMQRRVMVQVLRAALQGNPLQAWLGEVDEETLLIMLKSWLKAEEMRTSHSLRPFLAAEVAQVSCVAINIDNEDLILRLRLVGDLLEASSLCRTAEEDLFALAGVICLSLVVVWKQTLLSVIGKGEPNLTVPSAFLRVLTEISRISGSDTLEKDAVVKKRHLPLFARCLSVRRKIYVENLQLFNENESCGRPSAKSMRPPVDPNASDDTGQRDMIGSFDVSPINSNSASSSAHILSPPDMLRPQTFSETQSVRNCSVSVLISRILSSGLGSLDPFRHLFSSGTAETIDELASTLDLLNHPIRSNKRTHDTRDNEAPAVEEGDNKRLKKIGEEQESSKMHPSEVLFSQTQE